MKTIEKTRFDARIPKDQKDLFQQAADLGGFRTLTDFVIYSVKIQAEIIVKKHESIVASNKDRDVFFHALLNPPQPNADLKKATKKYNLGLKK